MTSPNAAPSAPRLLLIGWDAADWQVLHPLLDTGAMPNLQRLVEGGVIGNLASLSPMLSPMLWTSIATGKRAYGHGVHGFVEPMPDRSGLRPVGTRTRTCKALWNIISQSDRRSVVCGWQASHPAEPINGAMVSNLFAVPPADATPETWPATDGSVHPVELADELADLRLHPREIEGSLIQQLVPRAAELDQSNPNVQRAFMFLAQRLAEVISVHSLATDLLENEAWDFGAVYYECIDQIGHAFMPYHPPRLPEVAEADFEIFKDVMTGVYRFHDLMLERLLQLAGPETYVMIISDHGFQSGEQRPRQMVEPAQWHRPQGIFVLHGPGICADEMIEGATLLDIAPTVLTLLGLPVGNDMEGKVLANAFAQPREVERIPSWEEVPGPDGRIAPDAAEEDPAAAQAALQQLVQLGYIAPVGEDVARDIARAEAEAEFNLAASMYEGGRFTDAKRLLAGLAERHPDEPRYWRTLGQVCLAAQTLEEAVPALAALERLEPGRPPTLVLKGMLAWSRGDLPASAQAFEAAEKIAPNDPTTQTYLGRLYLRQRRWADAERAFRRTLAIDPDSAEAHYGLSVALPRQDQVEPGIEHALMAVGLRHDFPQAHFQLGAILSRRGWYDRAVQAFELTLRMQPGFVLAHRYLSRIHSHLGRLEKARHHREMADELVATNAPQPQVD
jgi:predicted AlkP superfamily phosphohydrolase/phosphomutase/tetratricopeptide (TPR) repeat protein